MSGTLAAMKGFQVSEGGGVRPMTWGGLETGLLGRNKHTRGKGWETLRSPTMECFAADLSTHDLKTPESDLIRLRALEQTEMADWIWPEKHAPAAPAWDCRGCQRLPATGIGARSHISEEWKNLEGSRRGGVHGCLRWSARDHKPIEPRCTDRRT
jgi:hypothetical protein